MRYLIKVAEKLKVGRVFSWTLKLKDLLIYFIIVDANLICKDVFFFDYY